MRETINKSGFSKAELRHYSQAGCILTRTQIVTRGVTSYRYVTIVTILFHLLQLIQFVTDMCKGAIARHGNPVFKKSKKQHSVQKTAFGAKNCARK